ncbi:MAG: hypothetical protein PHQ47_03055 [Candidatus Portnoybacteria bacterium]|nr:hypothetical protein [Candidatus Portnoybacteria bacterium]
MKIFEEILSIFGLSGKSASAREIVPTKNNVLLDMHPALYRWIMARAIREVAENTAK